MAVGLVVLLRRVAVYVIKLWSLGTPGFYAGSPRYDGGARNWGYIGPVRRTEDMGMTVTGLEGIGPRRPASPQPGTQIGTAVGGSAVGKLHPHQFGHGGSEVYLRNQGGADCPRLHKVGATYYQRHDAAGLERAILSPAIGSAGGVAASQFNGAVLIAIIQHGAIVAGQDDKGAFGQSLFAQSFGEASHRLVELQNGLAAQSHRALAAKAFVWHPRHMDVVRTEIEEEGMVGILVNKLHGMGCNRVGDVLIAPKCPAATSHIPDTPDAVDDTHVVAMTGALLGQEFGIIAPGRFAGEILAITHADGSIGIEVGHPAILDVDTGYPVGRSCHDVVVVKSQVSRTLVQLAVPILLRRTATQSQMPLAKGCRAIACCLKDIGHGVALGRYNHAGIACRHVRTLPAQGVLAGQYAISRRCAGGSTGVGICKPHTSLCQAINRRRMNALGAIAGQVAIA